MTPIRSPADLDAARGQPRAFLFLWVNWAVHARQSRRVVEDVVQAYRDPEANARVPCYMADVSDQTGELWETLTGWLTEEGRPVDLLFTGVGPLLWLRSGRVVCHVPAPLAVTPDQLVSATRSIFG